MKSLYQRLLAVLIGVSIFFVMGEIGCRAYFYLFKPLHRPSGVSGLLWEPNPGAEATEEGVRHKVNSRGFRDYEYPLEKPKGV